MGYLKNHTWFEGVCRTCGCRKTTAYDNLSPFPRVTYTDKNGNNTSFTPQCFDNQLSLFDGFQTHL